MPRILRKQLFKKVFALLLCLPLCGHYLVKAQVSGTYTINSTLPTGGTNFNSFTAAVAYLQTGLSGPVVFNVAAGTGPYNEQVFLGNTIGTTSANTLTFNCNGVTLSFTSNNTNSRAGIKLDNISYVTFDNLKITPQAAGQYGYGFHLLNNSDNNIIQNCQIVLPTNATTPANNEGIVINGNNGFATAAGSSNCDNNTIRNNTISGGNAGITLSSVPVSGAAVLMRDNKILNNSISDSYVSCIQLYYNDGTIVDGNDLQGGLHATTKVMGVYLNGFDQNVKVINNKIHNFHISNSVTGSYIYGILNSAQGAEGNVNLFASNLIYDFSSNGIQHGISSRFAAASYFNIYHNTISIDDQVIKGQESDGIYFENVSDVNVLNNIITISRPTTDWNYAFRLVTTMTRLTSNRNVYQVSGADFYNAVGGLASRRLDSLPLWQQVTGLDYSSVYEDPLYTNLAAFNFVPMGQPIDNMALFVNVTTDIIGATRSSLNPDPGCYEFVTPACQTPVKPGSTKVLPDTVMCYGPTIALGLKGNSWGVGQTYTWQSATSPTGTYTNISNGLAYPAFDILPATTTWYRAAVTCLGNTMYSAPIRVIIHTRLTGGTYTINSTQPTGGINFTSFSDAALAMQCGVTGPVVFNVAPNTGPYNEQLSLPSINNTPSQTIVFKGNGDTLAFAATSNTDRAVIKLNGIDYVTIDSLNINVTGASYGYGVQLIGDADRNTIKKCKIILPANITTTGYAGIVINNSTSSAIDVNTVSTCDSNTIVNNTITGGYYGITCTSKAQVAPIPLGNTFTGNRIVDACGFGIYMDGVASCVVDSNDISQDARTVFTNFNGIYVKQSWTTGVTSYGMQITRNKVHDLIYGGTVATVEAHGIHFETVAGMAAFPGNVSNNVMYNFWGVGRQYGLYSRSSNYLKVYHNTISLDDSLATPISNIVTCGYGLTGTATVGNEFINNNITIRRGGLTTRTGISVQANDLNLKADYNNYLISGATGINYIGSQNTTNYTSLSNWLAVKKDTNSVSIDPGYVNVPGGDLTPGNVPFENKGTALPAVPRDINDSTRSITKPDLGAHEFTICYPLSPLVVTIDSVGGNTIRFAWKPVTNATAYLVSRNGINWLTPSSGKLGTTHIVTGLNGLDTTGLIVKALGTRYDCPPQISPRIKSQTLSDDVFFPNMFSPNGNKVDDEFKVYSNVVKSMRLMIFNQWGQKVFETSDVTAGWDGTYQGKPQPVGVYVYVATLRLNDNTTVTKKGSLSLIR
ncbi:gliding motility-associated C-terminal domain-containing protein [Niastella sp. OAS944]|uniref:T9SS type B sorting domain-containing protein n=1 Tax=Niastella sp. OAS944 TaxID=2664089 RepID=UPI0034813AEA|nr:gliding motility-associated-like protein [Chitinophagaceae bacterium OAS944]